MSSKIRFVISVIVSLIVAVCAIALLAAHRLRHVETGAKAHGCRPGFYVWQREVSRDVMAAARSVVAESRELFVLAGEFDRKGGDVMHNLASDARPQFDFGNGDHALPSATAVFRVRVDALDLATDAGAAVAARAAALGARRVQLDVDAPERRLDDYAALAKAVRAGLPAGSTLSLTVLPCHLEHQAAARRLLSVADYAVLQLHGIDPPASLNECWRLMDPATVRKALARARTLGDKMRIALPSYAYVLEFAPDGAFSRLYAEGLREVTALPPGSVVRVASPDQALLAELLSDTGSPPAIWFRMPVPGGDRWCLDRETLDELERGHVPAPCVALDAEPLPAGNGFRVFATFRHVISIDPAEVPLHWRDEARAGEWIAVGGCVADVPAGRLPESVTLAPHACGERFLAAIVITDNRLFPDTQTLDLPPQ
jgi:hypothetical protein